MRRKPFRPQYRSRGAEAPPQRPRADEITGHIARRELSTPWTYDPRLPAAYDDRDVAAAGACRNGTASPEQQQRFVEWVVWAARTYDRTYRADPCDSAYLQGRREFGTEVVKLINLKTVKQRDSEQG
jgi:hypothetical protein